MSKRTITQKLEPELPPADLTEVSQKTFRKRIEGIKQTSTATGWKVVISLADGSKLAFEADSPISVKVE